MGRVAAVRARCEWRSYGAEYQRLQGAALADLLAHVMTHNAHTVYQPHTMGIVYNYTKPYIRHTHLHHSVCRRMKTHHHTRESLRLLDNMSTGYIISCLGIASMAKSTLPLLLIQYHLVLGVKCLSEGLSHQDLRQKSKPQ